MVGHPLLASQASGRGAPRPPIGARKRAAGPSGKRSGSLLEGTPVRRSVSRRRCQASYRETSSGSGFAGRPSTCGSSAQDPRRTGARHPRPPPTTLVVAHLGAELLPLRSVVSGRRASRSLTEHVHRRVEPLCQPCRPEYRELPPPSGVEPLVIGVRDIDRWADQTRAHSL
jgi:hypothetical protein